VFLRIGSNAYKNSAKIAGFNPIPNIGNAMRTLQEMVLSE
jgi:hypothetical protein